jgi:hypothetical protein
MRVIVIGTMIAVGCLLPTHAAAQARVIVVPAVSFTTTYDDNLFTTQNAQGDGMMQLTPSLEGFYDSPKASLHGLYSFDMQRAMGYSTLNTFEARRHGVADVGFQAAPKLRLSLAARYDMTDSPGELNLESAVLVGRRRAVRWQITPATSYRVTPRTTITAMYDGTNEALANRVGGMLHVGRLGVARQHSMRTVWNLNYVSRTFANGADKGAPMTGVDGDPGDIVVTGVDTDAVATLVDGDLDNFVVTGVDSGTFAHGATVERSHGPAVGWTRELARGTTLALQGGPRFTSYRGIQPEMTASLVQRTRRARMGFDYWQGESIILGIRGPVAVQSVATRATWYLRRNLEIGSSMGVFRSKTLEGAGARVIHAEAVTAWSPRGPYTIAASYGADFQRGDIRSELFNDTQVFRHVFRVRVTLAPTISQSIRPSDPNDPRSPRRVPR